jgi:hypothetical protein
VWGDDPAAGIGFMYDWRGGNVVVALLGIADVLVLAHELTLCFTNLLSWYYSTVSMVDLGVSKH